MTSNNCTLKWLKARLTILKSPDYLYKKLTKGGRHRSKWIKPQLKTCIYMYFKLSLNYILLSVSITKNYSSVINYTSIIVGGGWLKCAGIVISNISNDMNEFHLSNWNSSQKHLDQSFSLAFHCTRDFEHKCQRISSFTATQWVFRSILHSYYYGAPFVKKLFSTNF